MRWIHAANVILYGGLVIGSLLAWPELPERVPRRFDGSGNVTNWAEPGFTAWFVPVLVALSCLALLYAVQIVVDRWPGLLSLPRKHEFLALPRERRRAVARVIAHTTALSGIPIGLLFCGLQYWSWRAAVDPTPPVLGAGFLLVVMALGLMPAVFALLSIVPMNRALDEAVRAS